MRSILDGNGDTGANPGPNRITPRAIIVAEPGTGRDRACEAAALAGVRVVAATGFAAFRDRIEQQVGLDMLIVEVEGVDPDRLETVLDEVAAVTGADCAAILCFDSGRIDQVAARLAGANAQLLCEPSLAERVAALALTRRVRGGYLADATRDSEQERLRQLDEEVARIADALARLTGRPVVGAPRPFESGAGAGVGKGGGVRDRFIGYGAPPAAPASDSVDGPGDARTAGRIRSAIRARRMRGQFFEEALFADPAWDMLLDLYAAKLEHARVSVSSLCIAAGVPPTTALRWIATMSEAGLFDREADSMDRRRAFVILSDGAAAGMRAYVEAVDRAGLGIG